MTPDALRRFLETTTRLPVRLPPALVPAVRLVRSGEALMRAGEPSAGAFVVFAGLLQVHVDAPGMRRVRWAGPGDWVGELGVLSGAARSATVIAWRDSLVIPFTADQTRALLTTDPERLPALTEHLLALGARERPPRPGAYVLALEAPPDLAPWLESLAQRPLDGVRWITAAQVAAPDPIDQAAALARACEDVGLVVLLSSDADPAWCAAARRNADRIARVFHDDDPVPQGDPRRPTDLLLVHTDRADLTQIGLSAVAPYLVRPDAADDWIEYLQMIGDEHANPKGLRRFALFEGLSDADLARIQALVDWRFVKRGKQIITAGAAADGLYLVGLGRLQASVALPDGTRRILGDSPRGTIVGELSVLLDTPRAADVHALRDSRIGFIAREDFDALRFSAPDIGPRLAQVAARRAQGAAAPAGQAPPGALLVARLDAEAPTRAFAAALAATIRDGQGRRVAHITRERVERALGVVAMALRVGQPGYRRLLAWLNRISADHDLLIFECDADQTPWGLCCLRHVDRIVLVGRAGGDPARTALEARALAEPMPPPVELVLLQAQGIDQASGTTAWLEPRPTASVHHVRADTPTDLAAAARRIMGCAFGIAFAGASSRAPGHAGIVAAFERLGLPIDVTSGTSSGAFMAGACAQGLDAMSGCEHVIRFGLKMLARKRDLQPPYTSMLSGRRMSEAIHEMCGDRTFEDQLIPCRFSAVDLRTRTLVYLDRGSMWRAMRASTSIPVVYPPVATADQLLVDGGLISYIPANAILPWCADGMLALSDISDPTCWDGLAALEPYGTEVSGWRQLFDRLLPWRRPAPRPSITDVMFLSMIVSNALGEDRLEHITRHPAVCHVFLPFRLSSLFGATPPVVHGFAEQFREHAMGVLDAWLEARGRRPGLAAAQLDQGASAQSAGHQ